jgi:hypothetical protein
MEKTNRRLTQALCISLLLPACATMPTSEGMGGILDIFSTSGNGGESQIAAGLREALRVSTGRAVERTATPGGFLDVPRLRIPLPESLQTAAAALRLIGAGVKVDELEVATNRAAERASAEATSVFVDAIRGLTITDAQQILSGGDTAATQYFREHTESSLEVRFQPQVRGAMRQVGLYAEYEQLLARYEALPFAEKPNLDLTDYVTEHTMNGIFLVLGEEEKRIRRDSVACTSELLRNVFGSAANTRATGPGRHGNRSIDMARRLAHLEFDGRRRPAANDAPWQAQDSGPASWLGISPDHQAASR